MTRKTQTTKKMKRSEKPEHPPRREEKERAVKLLLQVISENARGPFSLALLDRVRRELTRKLASPAKAERTIQLALQQHLIDKVADDNIEEEAAGPAWHLRILPPKEREERQKLPPVAKALLHILWAQEHPDYLGELPQETAIRKLWALGYTEQETKQVERGIYNPYLVSHGIMTEWGKNKLNPQAIWWLELVHPYERTKEYQEEMEQIMMELEAKRIRYEEAIKTITGRETGEDAEEDEEDEDKEEKEKDE